MTTSTLKNKDNSTTTHIADANVLFLATVCYIAYTANQETQEMRGARKCKKCAPSSHASYEIQRRGVVSCALHFLQIVKITAGNHLLPLEELFIVTFYPVLPTLVTYFFFFDRWDDSPPATPSPLPLNLLHVGIFLLVVSFHGRRVYCNPTSKSRSASPLWAYFLRMSTCLGLLFGAVPLLLRCLNQLYATPPIVPFYVAEVRLLLTFRAVISTTAAIVRSIFLNMIIATAFF
ncbi:hypothetical protein Fcan01_13701 [Folsomia candida]|uniref:Uncharacterized protein n=1 Tax=Folsomia candida TaxID=158441 RepID=A0A226E2N3_FOLCA|nr:hypothetical protein Fcan01_13701 [Folsomia candida]